MQNDYAVSGHWSGEFSEAKLSEWAKSLRRQLRAARVSFGLVFMTPHYFGLAPQILEVLRVHAEIPLLLGCSSGSLVIDAREIEEGAGIVLSLIALPGAEVRGLHFTQEQVEEANGPTYWHLETGLTAEQVNGWLVFADPFHLDAEAWLRGWNEAYPMKPIQGGLAGGDSSQRNCQLYLDGEVFDNGGVAIALGGDVELLSVISQGCTPIGETWTITKAEQNFIHEIGNRPAYEVLAETFTRLPADQQQRTRGNLLIGLVVNEYLEDFHRGDFLVRNILGGDPKSGSLAVGALPRQGQTVQFQRRDAAAATEDMNELLDRLSSRLASRKIYGGCLCNCNGRGHRLFGHPNHDAGLIQEKLGPFPLTGFFCNGEIGPVGPNNFLHGYTASLALFTGKA
ncbi:MAG TPA: FIST N-terminal domain-containing protein [Candidatus Saccharimonadales bacterium]|nr:FIST N-terminal domain-containing protein [Candidatus Saccharimonadales bacterium]